MSARIPFVVSCVALVGTALVGCVADNSPEPSESSSESALSLGQDCPAGLSHSSRFHQCAGGSKVLCNEKGKIAGIENCTAEKLECKVSGGEAACMKSTATAGSPTSGCEVGTPWVCSGQQAIQCMNKAPRQTFLCADGYHCQNPNGATLNEVCAKNTATDKGGNGGSPTMNPCCLLGQNNLCNIEVGKCPAARGGSCKADDKAAWEAGYYDYLKLCPAK